MIFFVKIKIGNIVISEEINDLIEVKYHKEVFFYEIEKYDLNLYSAKVQHETT